MDLCQWYFFSCHLDDALLNFFTYHWVLDFFIFFQAGESSGKATVHTLRALLRIKLVRSSGENTYIIV